VGECSEGVRSGILTEGRLLSESEPTRSLLPAPLRGSPHRLASAAHGDVTRPPDQGLCDGTVASTPRPSDQGREFLVLVGPSGCGKTRRSDASLADGDHGRADQDRCTLVNRVPPKDRNIAMVFPVLRALPAHDRLRQPRVRLKLLKTPKEEIKRRVERPRRSSTSRSCSIESRRAPRAGSANASRSTGDRARARGVPDGRAVSNLDAKLRVQTRRRSPLAATARDDDVYVTPIRWAMTMGDASPS